MKSKIVLFSMTLLAVGCSSEDPSADRVDLGELLRTGSLNCPLHQRIAQIQGRLAYSGTQVGREEHLRSLADELRPFIHPSHGSLVVTVKALGRDREVSFRFKPSTALAETFSEQGGSFTLCNVADQAINPASLRATGNDEFPEFAECEDPDDHGEWWSYLKDSNPEIFDDLSENLQDFGENFTGFQFGSGQDFGTALDLDDPCGFDTDLSLSTSGVRASFSYTHFEAEVEVQGRMDREGDASGRVKFSFDDFTASFNVSEGGETSLTFGISIGN